MNLSRIQIPRGTSVTNCNHKHGLMLTCRHVHVRPHCFILTEACACRLELAYFAGKISKNILVCKNAVALAYYGSCRLLVMGSCQCQQTSTKRGSIFPETFLARTCFPNASQFPIRETLFPVSVFVFKMQIMLTNPSMKTLILFLRAVRAKAKFFEHL